MIYKKDKNLIIYDGNDKSNVKKKIIKRIKKSKYKVKKNKIYNI